MAHADGLSRLPLPHKPSSVPVPGDLILLINHLSECIITVNHIKAWTEKDLVLSRVRRLVQVGWTLSDPGPDFIPYFNRGHELSVLDGCALWGSCVVIPPTGHNIILNQLHEAHPGVSRMKCLARCFVWWPGLDSAIGTEFVRVKSVKQIVHYHLKHHYTLGNTLVDLGHVCTLIMMVHS